MSTFLLDRNAIKSLIEMLDLINVVDEASRMCGEGRGKIFAKMDLFLEHGDFWAMPAALPGYEGVKWVDVHPKHPYRVLLSIWKEMEINESSS